MPHFGDNNSIHRFEPTYNPTTVSVHTAALIIDENKKGVEFGKKYIAKKRENFESSTSKIIVFFL